MTKSSSSLGLEQQTEPMIKHVSSTGKDCGGSRDVDVRSRLTAGFRLRESHAAAAPALCTRSFEKEGAAIPSGNGVLQLQT